MKVIKVTRCLACPYLVKAEAFVNEAFCKHHKAPEFNIVKFVSRIPKWCPLEDL